MYATRQAAGTNGAFADENKKHDIKQASKGKAQAPTGQPSSRRVLGDIGNFMPARLTAGKDGPEVTVKAAAVEKGGTRRAFGRDVTNGKVNASNTTEVTQTTAPAPVAAPIPVPASWGATRPRTKARDREGETETNQNSASFVASNGAPQARAAAAVRGRIARKGPKKEPQSTTATLQARSAMAVGDTNMGDAEMVELEECTDIDSAHKSDPLHVVDYIEDIYAFYKRMEIHSMVPNDYILHQNDINEKMRGILMDWLIEVHLKFKLLPETLYLTANLIDRFLAMHQVSRRHLQLVGVTAMLLASKYEEVWAPEVRDFVYISDNAYNKDQILAMEKLMLNTLRFNLTVPTPYVFMSRFLKAARANEQMEHLSFCFMELTLPEFSMVRYSPSLLAAGAVYTAQRTLKKGPAWDRTMERHTGYEEADLRDCCTEMIRLLKKSKETYTARMTQGQTSGQGQGLIAVHKKYISTKMMEVAKVTPCSPPPAETCVSTA